MESLPGYLLAIVIAYFFIKHADLFPSLCAGAPKPKPKPVLPILPDCGCDEVVKCSADPPSCPTETKEGFAVYNQAEFPRGKPGCVHKPVKMGYTKPLYFGYSPYSYAYAGQPYGFHRPWWSKEDCSFPEYY
jgi:hypothetical protein